MNAKDLIRNLQLLPHPEGGYYKETYRSGQTIPVGAEKVRNVSTAIFYLLENEDRSVLHRIQSDELWFFHQGEPLEIVYIQEDHLTTINLGNVVERGEIPQAMVPANSWFAARIKSGSGFSLVSCTVAPGFDFADFEIGERNILLQEFPHLKATIKAFTK
jgi:predicted cupin superfamily sugar epimerase